MPPKKPFSSPVLCRVYEKRFIYQKDRNAYYSQLFSQLKAFIYAEKAAYAKECYFALEKWGYPPIDVKYALNHLRGIDKEPYMRYGNSYDFYYYKSMKRSKRWDKVRRDIIRKKLQIIADYQRRYLNEHKKGPFFEDLVYDTILFNVNTLHASGLRTFRFAGKRDRSGKKELDIIAQGAKTGKFYAIECKAHDSLVDKRYYEKELKSHFSKCRFYSKNPRRKTLHPAFIVRLCSDKVIDIIESKGAIIIQTEKIWYNQNPRLNERMRDELNHYFYTYIDEGKSPDSLVQKLESIETNSV